MFLFSVFPLLFPFLCPLFPVWLPLDPIHLQFISCFLFLFSFNFSCYHFLSGCFFIGFLSGFLFSSFSSLLILSALSRFWIWSFLLSFSLFCHFFLSPPPHLLPVIPHSFLFLFSFFLLFLLFVALLLPSSFPSLLFVRFCPLSFNMFFASFLSFPHTCYLPFLPQ